MAEDALVRWRDGLTHRIGDGPARADVLAAARCFVDAAIRVAAGEHASHVLDEASRQHEGFAMEGVALGAALAPAPTSVLRELAAHTRLAAFAAVGLGWACEVMRVPSRAYDDLVSDRGLVRDGLGCARGLLRPRLTLFDAGEPTIEPADRDDFDRGVGRSLWFIAGGDPTFIAAAIDRFVVVRRAAVWRGVGFAATYVGGLAPPVELELRTLAREWRSAFEDGQVMAQRLRGPALPRP